MNNQIGFKIRSIRKNLGLSMEEFGKLFNPPASKGVVSNWENNYNHPNNERLKKIAELGGVSVEYLLSDTEIFQSIQSAISMLEYLSAKSENPELIGKAALSAINLINNFSSPKEAETLKCVQEILKEVSAILMSSSSKETLYSKERYTEKHLERLNKITNILNTKFYESLEGKEFNAKESYGVD